MAAPKIPSKRPSIFRKTTRPDIQSAHAASSGVRTIPTLLSHGERSIEVNYDLPWRDLLDRAPFCKVSGTCAEPPLKQGKTGRHFIKMIFFGYDAGVGTDRVLNEMKEILMRPADPYEVVHAVLSYKPGDLKGPLLALTPGWRVSGVEQAAHIQVANGGLSIERIAMIYKWSKNYLFPGIPDLFV